MAPRLLHPTITVLCCKCGLEKPHYSRGGVRVWGCIDCRSQRAKDPAHRARLKVSYRDNLSRMIFDHARRRAREKGLVFALSLADIVVPERCPIFGSPLEVGNGKRSENSPTLDRIEPSLGYVPGNVWVISWRANRIKNDSTLDELRQIVAALESRQCSSEVA